ncbi:hypothetical protein [Shewanella frigidimarina]|uniref:hypothetical protein n=1 Tax=Shewanella frigidimarina TaxID=56812 RepID=UPI003D7B0F30
MFTILLATVLAFPSMNELPNGLKVDAKHLLSAASYIMEKPIVSKQKAFIDSLYDTQMQAIQSDITSDNQRFLNLISSKVTVGKVSLTSKNGQHKNVDIILDMSYRFNEARE